MKSIYSVMASAALSCLLVACGGGMSPGDPEVFSQPHPAATDAGALAPMAVPTPRQAATVRTPDATSFLNWAEASYPSLFETLQVNSTIDVWTYRYYRKTDIYLGINTSGDVLGLLGKGGGSYESIPLGKISTFACSVYPSDCAPKPVVFTPMPIGTTVDTAYGFQDSSSCLIWSKSPNALGKTLSYYQLNTSNVLDGAYVQIKALRLGGKADWRLPTIDELQGLYKSMTDGKKPGSTWTPMHPSLSAIPVGQFWSSTLGGNFDPLRSYFGIVHVLDYVGNVHTDALGTTPRYTWAVREEACAPE